MSEFIDSLSLIAPIYNVALTLLAYFVLATLIVYRKRKTKSYVQPWKYLFAALTIFLIEEVITIMKFFNIISDQTIPRTFNASFELIIIILFIMMVISQLIEVERLRSKKISNPDKKIKKKKNKQFSYKLSRPR